MLKFNAAKPKAALWHDRSNIEMEGMSAPMDVMLYLDNLSPSTTEDELAVLFTQVGEVTGVKIHRDRVSGVSRGYGFLSMSMLNDADRAISRFNTHLLNGNELQVRLSKPRAVRGNDPISK